MDRLDIRLCRHYIGKPEEFWDRGQKSLDRCLQDSRIRAAKGGAEPLAAGGQDLRHRRHYGAGVKIRFILTELRKIAIIIGKTYTLRRG